MLTRMMKGNNTNGHINHMDKENKWELLRQEFDKTGRISEVEKIFNFHDFSAGKVDMKDAYANGEDPVQQHFEFVDLLTGYIISRKKENNPIKDQMVWYILYRLGKAENPFAVMLEAYHVFNAQYRGGRYHIYASADSVITSAGECAENSKVYWPYFIGRHMSGSDDTTVRMSFMSPEDNKEENLKELLYWLHEICDFKKTEDSIFFIYVVQLLDKHGDYNLKELISKVVEQNYYGIDECSRSIIADELIMALYHEKSEEDKGFYEYCLGMFYRPLPKAMRVVPTAEQYYSQYWLAVSAAHGNELAGKELAAMNREIEENKQGWSRYRKNHEEKKR